MANLEQKTFEDLPINKPLDISELSKFAFNSDFQGKSTKEVIKGWIEQEIGTETKGNCDD